MRRFGAILAAVVFLAVVNDVAAGQEAGGKSTTFGVKAGLLTPGAIYWHEGPYSSYDLDLGLSAGGFLDYAFAPKLSGGLFVDATTINAWDEGRIMIEGGFSLKGTVGGGSGKLTWRPGFGVGYGTLASIYLFEGTTYLTLRAGTEVLIPAGNRTWLGELMVYGAPSGGNANVTVTFGPVALLRFGILF